MSTIQPDTLPQQHKSGFLGKPGASRTINIAILVALLIVFPPLFLLSFHVLSDVPTIIPKEHLTFSDTFLSIDEVVDRFNNSDNFGKRAMKQTGLFRILEERGLIKERNTDESE